MLGETVCVESQNNLPNKESIDDTDIITVSIERKKYKAMKKAYEASEKHKKNQRDKYQKNKLKKEEIK
jgi:hypothetical protein